MVLHVIVTVEEVVLSIVLVLGGYHYLAETLPKLGTGADAEVLLGICIPTPCGIDLCQILNRFPIAFVNNSQYSRAVSTRFAAEDAVKRSRPLGCTLGVLTLSKVLTSLRQVFLKVLYHVVLVRRLIQGGHQLHRLIKKKDQVGEGIAEKAADTDRDVYSGAT